MEGLEVDVTYDFDPDIGTGADVTIELYDPSGIDYIKLDSGEDIDREYISSSEVKDSGIVKKTIKLQTDMYDLVNGWELDLTCVNEAGNTFKTGRKVDGVVHDIYEAVRSLPDHFMNLMDNLWGTIVDKASDAADVAARLADSLVDHVKDKAKSMVESAISGIKEKIEGWATDVNSLLEDALEEYDSSGSISSMTLNKINEKLKYLYVAVFASATAILTALNALMVFSGGVGSVGFLVVPVCVGVMMTQLFDSDRTSGRHLDGIDSNMGIDAILDFSEDYLEDQMLESNSMNGAQLTDSPDPEESWDVFWGGLSALFGWESFLFGGSAIAAANMDVTGNLGAIYGISAALLGVAMGIAAMVEPGAIGYVAMVFGVESFVLSGITLYQVAKGSGLSSGAGIAAGISSGLAGLATYFSLKSLDLI